MRYYTSSAGDSASSAVGQLRFEQRRAIETFVKQRDWHLHHIYTDAGLSGRLDERPALTQLLTEAEHGQFDVVVVHAIDRFYRSLTGLLTAIEHLRQHQVSLVSINEALDFTTPWGKLTLAVLGTLAEIYIDKLSAETTKGKLERARKGLYNGSIPFGYCNGLCSTCTDPNGPGYCPHVGEPDRSQNGHPIGHPIERIGVRRAFKLSVLDRLSDRQIADALNDKPVRYHGQDYTLRPKRRPGDVRRFGPPVFQKDSVRELLLRVFYTGMVPYFGTAGARKRKRRDAVSLHPGQHPVLIPQPLYEQAQAARDLRHNAPISDLRQTRVHLLSGMLICGHCGKSMRTVSNVHGTRYYRCATRLQQTDACPQQTLHADVVDEQVAAMLQQYRLPADWRQRLDAALLGERGDPQILRERLDRARELYLDGDLSRDEYELQRARYRFRLADLTDSHYGDILSVGKIFDKLPQLWHNGERTLKRKLLQALLEAVTIRGESALSGWQPNSALYPILRHTICAVNTDGCHCGSDGASAIGKHNIELLPPPLKQASK